MDGHRPVDSMTDASLEHEIESMLGVEPSPEFMARVRVRVAQEPEPWAWRSRWLWAAPGVAVVMMAAVIAWPSRELGPAGPQGPAPPPQRSRAVETIAPGAAAVSQPQRTPPVTRAVATAAPPDRAIEIDLPEVLIAENEAQTFAALVASVRQSRFDMAVPAAPDPDRPLEITELPIVEPLEIEPIVKLAALQAEGERP
jgi:hypothetical protein